MFETIEPALRRQACQTCRCGNRTMQSQTFADSRKSDDAANLSGHGESPKGARCHRSRRASAAMALHQAANRDVHCQHKRRGGGNRMMGRDLPGCQARGLWIRFPPPDSGVVPFSEVPSSPIKSEFSASGRVGCRSGASSRFHRPRFRKGSNPSTWGRNGNR
jgi:hypothetical protein